MIFITAFYKFVSLDTLASLQSSLLDKCRAEQLKGTILLASEGINGGLSGSKTSIDRFLAWIREDSRFSDIESKNSVADFHPFKRLKVKIKQEIIAFEGDPLEPCHQTGISLDPKSWNDLIKGSDVTVIDTRNVYESAIGSFKEALRPELKTFQDFAHFAEENLKTDQYKKIAMFCTGGIRCEKASHHLLSKGFTEVYQLKGGILNYFEHISPADSLWEGECFVFDDRVSVQHDLTPGSYRLCSKCGHPVRVNHQESNQDQPAPVCQHCFG